MKRTFSKSIIGFGILALLAASCTKSFEEVNTDPDAFEKVPPTNMLANVFRNTGESFGGDIDGYGTFAGYIVKIQYMDYMSGLIPTNNTYGNRWYNCYYNITQLDDILVTTQETAELYKNMRFVARIWQNYMWSYLTDGWGDIPYSETLKGSEEKGGIVRPKYDKQEEIYPAILASLKTIADEMAEGIGEDELDVGDIIYYDKEKKLKDEMLRWQRFCNSLRLRIAIRISGVAENIARTTIEEIAVNPEKYPVLVSNEDNCYLRWPGSSPQYDPWYKNGYADDRRVDNYGMSDIFIDHLLEMEDPRIAKVANKNIDGEYRGYINGAEGNPSPLQSISFIGDKYMNDPKGFTPFYKSCETYYLLAEAAMLGYNVGISAKEAYERAVRLSMEDNQIEEAAIVAYLEGKGAWNNSKERIWWDAWVALFKNNFEAWTLYRRTGVPNTNYPSKGSVFGDAHNDQPFRLPYPNNEYQYNRAQLDIVLTGVVDYVWGKQMWWDKRSDVY